MHLLAVLCSLFCNALLAIMANPPLGKTTSCCKNSHICIIITMMIITSTIMMMIITCIGKLGTFAKCRVHIGSSLVCGFHSQIPGESNTSGLHCHKQKFCNTKTPPQGIVAIVKLCSIGFTALRCSEGEFWVLTSHLIVHKMSQSTKISFFTNYITPKCEYLWITS